MKTAFELVAEFRDAQGKGASRRLRHANKVPAILYGGHREPRALSLDHTRLLLLLDNERFYSTIINLKVGEQNQAAILKDVQRHPAKNASRPHRPAARPRQREDPHHDPAALQGRGRLAGRQEGRRGFAPAQRGRDHLPAEGPAGVHRGRPVGCRSEPDAVPGRSQRAGRRRGSRADARSQCADRLDPPCARGRRTGSGGGRRSGSGCCSCGGSGAGAAAASRPRVRQRPSRQRVRRRPSRPKPRRTPRSNANAPAAMHAAGERGPPCTGRPDFRFFQAERSSWPAHRCRSWSGSAIRDPNTGSRATTRDSGSSTRLPIGTARSFVRTRATRARSPKWSSRARSWCC